VIAGRRHTVRDGRRLRARQQSTENDRQKKATKGAQAPELETCGDDWFDDE
jgi:hypothetical protein